MKSDNFTENYLQKLSVIQKIKHNKKMLFILCIILLILLCFSLFVISVFAETNVKLLLDETDKQFLYFEIDHKFVNAKYKYFGYGYTIALYDRSKNQFLDLNGGTAKQVFLPNSTFNSTFDGDTEKVKIYIEKLLEATDIEEEEFWNSNLTIYLNGRIGIKVDEKLVHLYDSLEGDVIYGMPDGHDTEPCTTKDGTAPLNSDGFGILNAIKKYYGVDWSSSTQRNLKQHFGISYDLEAVEQYNGILVEYRYNNQKLGVDNIISFDSQQEYILYPKEFEGYDYTGRYKIGYINYQKQEKTGDYASVSIKKESKIYHVIFYYDKKSAPPLIDGYTKYKVKYISKDDNSEISSTDFMSPNEIKTETIEPAIFIGYEYADEYKIKYYQSNGYLMNSKDGKGNPSIPIKLETNYYVIELYYNKGEEEELPTPECEIIAEATDFTRNIYLTDKEFNELDKINTTIYYGIASPIFGYDGTEDLIGWHALKKMSYKLYDENNAFITSIPNATLYSYCQPVTISKAELSEIEPNEYNFGYTFQCSLECQCGSTKTVKGQANVRVHVKVNHPPVAIHETYTELLDKDNNKVQKHTIFVNTNCKVKNSSYDIDGIQDIKTEKYIFSHGSDNYYVLVDCINGEYSYNSDNLPSNIKLCDVTMYGDLILNFNNTTVWNLTQIITDQAGATGQMESQISPKIMSLKPIAELIDQDTYRYPDNTAFNGKQNRTVAVSAAMSKVAEFWEGLDVEIDHSKDCLEIIPLNNQDLDNIKFDQPCNIVYENNKAIINNINLNNFCKLMFKNTGKYTIRLKVTDTKGNTSDYVEKQFTIAEDKSPTVTAYTSSEIYRDSSGIATISIKDIVCKSVDEDIAEIEEVYYLYDSNNDGNFDNESIVYLSKDNYTTVKTKNLGRYRFYIITKEQFGQDSLLQYITDDDVKRGSTVLDVLVNNNAPTITDFKVTR